MFVLTESDGIELFEKVEDDISAVKSQGSVEGNVDDVCLFYFLFLFHFSETLTCFSIFFPDLCNSHGKKCGEISKNL